VPFWLSSVELEFVMVELEFVMVELESKLAITLDRVNENRERINRKLIEKRAKKLYLSNLV
jgi:hypothetical protein